MSIDKQGKGSGEGAVERDTSRSAENKPSEKSTILGVPEDPRFDGLTPMCAPIHVRA